MDRFVVDADAFIDFDRHYRGQLKTLKRLAGAGSLTIPGGVARELLRKSDTLSKRVKQWQDDCTDFVVKVDQDPRMRSEFARIEREYGDRIVVGGQTYTGFWSSHAGKKAADGQVVSVAKVLGSTAVSDDLAVKLACMLRMYRVSGGPNSPGRLEFR
jgi:hypothetical protein